MIVNPIKPIIVGAVKATENDVLVCLNIQQREGALEFRKRHIERIVLNMLGLLLKCIEKDANLAEVSKSGSVNLPLGSQVR